MPRVEITTDDGVVIVGEHREGPSGGPAVLLLHMMPATKESWEPLADALAGRGFSTLAIDLRGHGESVRGAGKRKLDYRDFSDEEHRAKMKDVEAAMRWLEGRGIDPSRIGLAGASIGANLSIAYAGGHGAVPAVVALSPGLDYRGVATEAAAAAMPRERKLLLAASEEDEYAFSSVHALARAKADAELQELKGAGHGTTMLEREPGFFAYVVEWISNNVR